LTVDRREMLRWSALGAGAMLVGSAARPVGLPSLMFAPTPIPPVTVASPIVPATPLGINPDLFARAKAALDTHRAGIRLRDTIGVVDFSLASHDPRFHLVDLFSGKVDTFLVAHGRGSDPDHSGFVEKFSNVVGSSATSNGAYATGDFYEGKYGLSMKVDGLDGSNCNAESRAIVIHNAWYAEPEMIPLHGKLGRSEGCFAFGRADQQQVMHRLSGARMIYADKIA
jgi:L,D-transpeptidase catalytic domain